MKKAENRATRKGFMLGQCRRGATGIKRLRGRQHNAPAPSAVMLKHGMRGHALGAVLSLALLLFSSPGLLAAITGASARTPNQLSARSWAERPTKTPPPRHSPTPTTVPSPTAPATPAPAPSPTFTAIPTVRTTVPASAAPPGKATTPAATGKPGGSPRPTPVSTPSTGSPAVHHPSRVQHKGEGAFLPLVLGALSGIAAVALLVAGGRWLLRQWLLPVRKVKGPPSGAASWQRVRTTSLPGSTNSPGDRRQPFPTTDALPTVTHVLVQPQSNGTLLITLTGTHFAPYAELIIDGQPSGTVSQSTSQQVVAVVSRSAWSAGQHALGVRNPDGTAAQMALSDVSDDHNRYGTPQPTDGSGERHH